MNWKTVKRKANRFYMLLEENPFDMCLSFALVLFGLRALLTGLAAAPGSVQNLPFVIAVTYCILSVLGGSLVIVSILLRSRVDWAYGLNVCGLIVSASAWGSYIIGLSFSPTITRSTTLLILALFALVAACFLRSRAIDRREKALLAALRLAAQDRDDQGVN